MLAVCYPTLIANSCVDGWGVNKYMFPYHRCLLQMFEIGYSTLIVTYALAV